MLDFGIESVKRYNECAYYGRIWLVEFRDYTSRCDQRSVENLVESRCDTTTHSPSRATL